METPASMSTNAATLLMAATHLENLEVQEFHISQGN